ncbi:MAG: amidohydrolase [Verrucomicrobia bacterium]|nr:amidohydrolase [Verrucomicrobiota bacterium]
MNKCGVLILLLPGILFAGLSERVDKLADAVEDKVIEWRHDLHQHPELSNQEFRTAAKVANHLKSLGYEVQTEVAVTGVVGVLKGGKPGPVVALRADMDGLPVTEKTGLPYASTVKAEYGGKEVGVMHACGHDAHVAITMGAAEVLANMRNELPGTVKIIFQPAEEGAWPATVWGAQQMIQQGVLQNPQVDAIFGLHVRPGKSGAILVKPGPFMASSDFLRITVTGKQTHAAIPWGGIDPITISAQIILGLQTVASRQVDILGSPSIVSIGTVQAGERNNIIPDQVIMTGTIRTFDHEIRSAYHERVTRTAEKIAESAGATAEVYIGADTGYSPTINHVELTKAMTPTLQRVAGKENLFESTMTTLAEDFSFFQKEIPGMFFFLGVTPPGRDLLNVAANHSPLFLVDDAAMITGVRAMSHLVVDYMIQNQ